MKSEEVFRFANVRPVQRAPEDRIQRAFATYGEGKKTPLLRAVEALEGSGAREKAIELARRRLTVDEPNANVLSAKTFRTYTAAGINR